ncbi:MAG TPA: response regulator [Azospirillaceae bacterium]|nr:response regulator [Azospirillaceae bacterium]
MPSAAGRTLGDASRAARLLIVEDELLIAWSLQEALAAAGHEVVSIARSADEAVAEAVAEAPDLVVMDVNLGRGGDGVDAAARIRQDRDVPVLYVTAYRDDRTLRRVADATPGAQVLAKPLAPGELETAVARILGDR